MNSQIALTLLLLAPASAAHAVIAGPSLASGHVTVDGSAHLTTAGSKISRQATLVVPGTQLTEITGTSGGALRLTGGSSISLGKNPDLIQGNALVSTGKGRFLRRSTDLHLGPLGLTCKGTVLLAHQPDSTIKITVLEGTATARFDSAKRDFIQLGPGDMLLADPSIEVITPPVTVDLSRLASSSRLVSAARHPLPRHASAALQKNIDRQQRAIASGKLLASTVVVSGSGGDTTVGTTSGDGGNDNNNSGGASTGSSSGSSTTSSGSTSASSSTTAGNNSGGSTAAAGSVASAGGSALSAASACG